MRGWFVTGTDTGVGKTTVACAILAAARLRGLRTAAMKPAETGCSRVDGVLVPADAVLLAQEATIEIAGEDLCPYRFEEALAPGVAARRLGTTIDFAGIMASFRRIWARKPDLLLVEGAGGLLVPLGQGRSTADLAVALELSMLVVAKDGLGTINHTLLTIEVARARGIDVGGVIFSSGETGTGAREVRENMLEVESATGVRILGHLRDVREKGRATPMVDRLAERGSAGSERERDDLGRWGEEFIDMDAILENSVGMHHR